MNTVELLVAKAAAMVTGGGEVEVAVTSTIAAI